MPVHSWVVPTPLYVQNGSKGGSPTLCKSIVVRNRCVPPWHACLIQPKQSGEIRDNRHGDVSSAIADGQAREVKLLSRAVVQHLAAGEVIDGPAAVIRELVENAIDAGATSIVANLNPMKQSVTVQDNGYGISLHEGLPLIATCNATSKLRNVHELGSLQTLGFRGQALWAIATVADSLSVSSRSRGSRSPEGATDARDIGIRAFFGQDGSLIESRPVAMAFGTIACAEGLRSLNFGAKSMRECKQWIMRASLCHSDKLFTVQHRGKTVWNSLHNRYTTACPYRETEERPVVKEAFARILARDSTSFRHGIFEDSMEIQSHVEVVAGLPSLVQYASSGNIVVAVNGRCVDVPELSGVIRKYFRSRLPPRRYPAVFVHVKVRKPNVCNWNLHPMKATMRLGSKHAPFNVSQNVVAALNKALMPELFAVGASPIFATDRGNARYSMHPMEEFAYSAIKAATSQNVVPKDEVMNLTNNDESDSDIMGRNVFATRTFFELRPVAQVLGTYIIAEHDHGIVLIEQHVAHERILFEKLQSKWSASFVALSAEEEIVLPSEICENDERVLNLSSLGFEVEFSDSENCSIIRSVPGILRSLGSAEILKVIFRFSDANCTVDDAAARLACRAAVKNGVLLSKSLLNDIVNSLRHCANPHTCPHGRPIFWDIGQQDLAAVFRRRWVPKPPKKHRINGQLKE